MSQKVVVDTSVIVKWLNQTNELNIESADRLLNSALKGEIDLLAPELARYELGNVLLNGKQLTVKEANISIGTAYTLPIHFVQESEELAKQTYALASKLGITYYDASFISLAKQYRAILITENLKHHGKSTDIKVKPLKEY